MRNTIKAILEIMRLIAWIINIAWFVLTFAMAVAAAIFPIADASTSRLLQAVVFLVAAITGAANALALSTRNVDRRIIYGCVTLSSIVGIAIGVGLLSTPTQSRREFVFVCVWYLFTTTGLSSKIRGHTPQRL